MVCTKAHYKFHILSTTVETCQRQETSKYKDVNYGESTKVGPDGKHQL